MRKPIIITTIAVVVVSLGTYFVWPSSDANSIPVRQTTAKKQTLVESVSAPGNVEPKRKVDVSAEVSARILELPLREGAQVKKGDVLVKLDGRNLMAALTSAEARRDGERFRLESERSRILGTKENLDNSQLQLTRQKNLFETGDVSKQALEDAQTKNKDLQSQLKAAEQMLSQLQKAIESSEAEIEEAREALRKTTITSPIDGVVTLLSAEVGELVMVGTMNNAGTRIMTVADLTEMRLNARVSETDIARVAIGAPATIYINAYKDQPFTGKVDEIALSRTIEKDGTSTYKVLVSFDLNGKMIPSGLSGNVDLNVASNEGIVVPSQAIVDRKVDELPSSISKDPLVQKGKGTTPIVLVVKDGRVSLRPVLSGVSNLTDSIVLQGVQEGETVITGPYRSLESLKEGDRVREEEDKGNMRMNGPGGGGGGGRRGGMRMG
ncbi:MAG: efflux RND transporter periplasmic adaptor subunit [Planctomycetes bacterium]|nr:efflux RND transporter periplasmic adaptor subunit [Planctomycetota bacterium]